MLGLGFGFVEVGTVTPRPQAGNPKPRLFRLAEDRAVINRMGFNNEGQAAALDRLQRVRSRRARRRSASTSAPTRTAPTASPIMSRACGRWRASREYLTINISSPNTPGLRAAAGRRRARALLSAVERGARANGAADLPQGRARPRRRRARRRSSRAAIEHGVDAMIVANTTVSRPRARSRGMRGEAGGLSGAPLKPLALQGAARFPLARPAAKCR